MNYTKDTLRIEHPSAKLLETLQIIRENKQQQLEKLRNMKPEEFGMRISL